jgi:hypothetical protein
MPRKTIDDYSKDEILKFDLMHKTLTEYNKKLGTKNEIPLPKFASNEMSAYSVYRELLIAKESEED